MKLNIVHFFLAWWFQNTGIIIYAASCIWAGLNEFEIGTCTVLLFATLTKEHYVKQSLILCSILSHLIIFLTLLFMYMYESKKKIVLLGCILLSIIPNQHNPFRDHLFIKLIVYCLIVYRINKSSGLPISKYICFSWIFFTHVGCLIFLPIQIVYDTYNYKINFNV